MMKRIGELKADLRNCITAIRVKEEENARLKAEVDRLAMSEGYHYTAVSISTLKEQLHKKHLDYIKAWNANEANVEMIKSLKAEVEHLTWLQVETLSERNKAEAQVERLTKAGDAMHIALDLADDIFDNHEKDEAQDGWLAAKEGKPRD